MSVKFTDNWKYRDNTFEFNLTILGVNIFDLYYYHKIMAGVMLFGFGVEWEK